MALLLRQLNIGNVSEIIKRNRPRPTLAFSIIEFEDENDDDEINLISKHGIILSRGGAHQKKAAPQKPERLRFGTGDLQ